MQPTPVKEAAIKHGIPVYQPKKIRNPECVEELRKYNADVMVVIAFGQIIPKEILEMTPYGCINVHASLLPKYRGAAPIQWSIALSHVNDAGFWLVTSFLEIDEKTTLKSWTIMETLIGVTALIVSFIVSIFA